MSLKDALIAANLAGGSGGGSDLPDVTSADNGDVLTVVNGAWDKATPSGGDYPIRYGDGENSAIVGDTTSETEGVFTIYLSGAANATTYTFTTSDTIPANASYRDFVLKTTHGSVSPTISNFYPLKGIDVNNKTITLEYTLHKTKAASGVESVLYYKCKKALNTNSYVEGNTTFSAKLCAHAEGINTKALKNASHAEGYSCSAMGEYAHAEGNETLARAVASHAEGTQTIANGSYSHAEGMGTVAEYSCQHVEGKFNVSGDYIHIVGNGSSANSRSNAYTLDLSGNGSYAGNLTLGMGTENAVTITPAQLSALLELLN